MRFFGRTEELENIKLQLFNNKQSNILIYGKRRIGKSYLINKAISDLNKKVIYYQCKDINPLNSLEELTDVIISVLDNKYLNFKSFDLLLNFLFTQTDVVVVLDEYPYLRKRIEGLDSIIQQKIDKYKDESNLKLILLGSYVDVMKNIIEYGSPLFGRFNLVINLKEQNYLESSMYYSNYSYEDKVTIYSIFGGEPYFNALIDDTKTVYENIKEIAIKENSVLELVVETTLANELNRLSALNDVLLVIAGGKKKNKDIADKTYLDSNKIDYILKKLIDLDIIEKVTPINDLNNHKKILYNIKSNSIDFYYRFIYKNKSYRTTKSTDDFYKEYIVNEMFNQYIPKKFEKIAKEFLIKQNKNNLLSESFNLIGTYWFDDAKNKINRQFDVVTLDNKGYISYECKYIDSLIDMNLILEEESQTKSLDIDFYKLGFITKHGFTDDVNKEKYICYNLEDIYRL